MIHWINMKWYNWKAMVKTLKKRASMAGSAVCPLENNPLSIISHFYNLCLPIFVQFLLKWLLCPISCMFWTNLAPPISLPLQWNFKKKSWHISPFFYFWEISQNSVLLFESDNTLLKDSGRKVYCTTPQESKCQRRKLNI